MIELVPPYVATDLGKESKVDSQFGPQPMPLEAFIAETMKALEGDADDVVIGDARKLVAAAGGDSVRQAFAGMNH